MIKENKKSQYNSDINVIGSIPDYQLIVKVIELYSQGSNVLKEAVIKRNEFDFKTENSRKRFLAAVESAFLNFQNDAHQELIISLFTSSITLSTKQLILFWQFSLSNRLFYEPELCNRTPLKL